MGAPRTCLTHGRERPRYLNASYAQWPELVPLLQKDVLTAADFLRS